MADYYCVIEKTSGVDNSPPTYWTGDGMVFDKLERAFKMVDKGDAARMIFGIKDWPVGCRVAEIDNQPRAVDPHELPLRERLPWFVDRFLSWKLPEDFSPDAGISFKRTFNDHLVPPMRHEPIGTNLLTAEQAKAMLIHILRLDE